MKLLRFGKPGKEKPGMLDHDGKLRDLSGVIADIGPEQISPKGLAKLAKLKLEKLPLVRGKPRLGVRFQKSRLFFIKPSAACKAPTTMSCCPRAR